jgi:hypothetical protein
VSERRDAVGTLVGLLVFLAGIGLIGFTFYLAYDLFTTPPQTTVGIEVGKPMNLSGAAGSLLTVVVRIVMLAVMAVLGSVVANRGVRLYAAARPMPHGAPPPKDAKPPAESGPAKG